MFWLRNKKNNFQLYALLSRGLILYFYVFFRDGQVSNVDGDRVYFISPRFHRLRHNLPLVSEMLEKMATETGGPG